LPISASNIYLTLIFATNNTQKLINIKIEKNKKGYFMLKVAMIITFLVAVLVGDNVSLGEQISKGVVKKVKKKVTKKVKKTYKFRKDDHRYDKRYRDFDYDRYGYYNDDGFYFGYFDRRGYFFNNIYFEYNSRFSYPDRLYRRGPFAPCVHHYRRYRYHRDNDWNRVHRYREPNIIVYGNYYENAPVYYDDTPSRPAPVVYYNSVRDRARVISRPYRRDTVNRVSQPHRRDRYRRERYYNSNSRSYQRRDTGRVIYHRFSNGNDKKSHQHKSNGRLSITK
jgi:hypothetical protein